MHEHICLLPPCFMDMLYPQALSATTNILQWMGFKVILWEETYCCGQPAWNAGALHPAQKLISKILRWTEHHRIPIVIPSASCAGFLKTRAQEHHPQASQYLFEACHFIYANGLTQKLPSIQPRETVVLHNSCSALREYMLNDIPARLLNHCGFTPVEPANAQLCCGFGGTFSVKFTPVSIAMGEEKLKTILACKGTTVTSADWSCLMHLQGIARTRPEARHLRFAHVCELLWQSIREHG